MVHDKFCATQETVKIPKSGLCIWNVLFSYFFPFCLSFGWSMTLNDFIRFVSSFLKLRIKVNRSIWMDPALGITLSMISMKLSWSAFIWKLLHMQMWLVLCGSYFPLFCPHILSKVCELHRKYIKLFKQHLKQASSKPSLLVSIGPS